MRRSRAPLAAGLALTTLTTMAGCVTHLANSDAPNAPITAAEFDSAPCDVYSPRSLVRVIQPVLTAAGWPKVVESRPDVRFSAQVQRCGYSLTVARQNTYGDQGLTVYVYNEMSNGRRLMDACEARRASRPPGTPSPSAPALGDEACLDGNGQWRFRVGDRYVSVAVDIPVRRLGDGTTMSPASTGTFVATQDVATKAAVSRAIAENLARRLR